MIIFGLFSGLNVVFDLFFLSIVLIILNFLMGGLYSLVLELELYVVLLSVI